MNSYREVLKLPQLYMSTKVRLEPDLSVAVLKTKQDKELNLWRQKVRLSLRGKSTDKIKTGIQLIVQTKRLIKCF